MPKSCFAGNGCEFRHICEPYKNVIPTELMSGVEWIEQAKKIIAQMQESKLENCPLVEVSTSHGRLIDADKLMDDICSALNEMTKIGIAVDGEWLWGKLNDAIDNA